MKKALLILVLVFCVSTASMAVNELVNGGFEDGLNGWTVSGNFGTFNSGDWSVLSPEGVKYAGFITSWGGNQLGEVVQWVDEAMFPGWDPEGVGKIITIGGFSLLHARHSGGVTWENVWLDVGIDFLNPFTMEEELIWVGQINNLTYNNEIAWYPFEYVIELPFQPQFVSAHFKLTNKDGMEWSYAFVDGLYLEGECIPVPEPSSMLALGTGLMGLAGFAIRRRK